MSFSVFTLFSSNILEHSVIGSKCFKRLALVALLLVTTLSVLGMYFQFFGQSVHEKREIGFFNQGPLQDVSALYESQNHQTIEIPRVLEELRRDGFNPMPISEIVNLSFIDVNSRRKKNHTSEFIVPKVVHYVWMGSNRVFSLCNYLSFLSVERFIKPFQIFLHCDVLPTGKWWDLVRSEVKNIYYVKRPSMDTAPNGQPLNFGAHASDYIRAEVLVRYGGIYLDTDVLVLKSFDPLLKYRTVLGREAFIGICTGVAVACKGSPFMRMMLEQYRSYRGYSEFWGVKAVINIHILAYLFPHTVHVEEDTMNHPNYFEKVHIYQYQYDWSENYAIHTWVRSWPDIMKPTSLETVVKEDTTFGELTRAIIYGSNRSDPRVSRWTTRPLVIGLLLQL